MQGSTYFRDRKQKQQARKYNNKFTNQMQPYFNDDQQDYKDRGTGDYRDYNQKFATRNKSQSWGQKAKQFFGIGKRKCRVKGCTEGHQIHYCKACKMQDSDHFTRGCPYIKRIYGNNNNYDKNSVYTNQNHQRLFPSNGSGKGIGVTYPNQGLYGNDRTFKNKVQYRGGCRVKGCPQRHQVHYCRNCKKIDSDHFGRDCPYRSNSRQKYEQGRNQAFKNKGYKSDIFSSAIDSDDQPRFQNEYQLHNADRKFSRPDPNKDSNY